jgi:hypothetical protein
MARTLLGILRLVLQDGMSGPAKGAAKGLNELTNAAKNLKNAADGSAMDKVAAGIKAINDRANSAQFRAWSVGFEKMLARLKVSAAEMAFVRRAWDDLNAGFARNNIDKALQKTRVSEWRNAMIAYLLGTRSAMDQTGAAAEKMAARTNRALGSMRSQANSTSASMNRLKNAISVAVIGGAGAYGTGFLMRGAVQAPADLARERFRQRMAGMSPTEVAATEKAAFQQSRQFKSVLPVQGMEMGRTARAMMGSTERGLEILPDLVKGLVTLQSVKGLDVASNDMSRLLRGIDNLGQNDLGGLGIKQTREIIDGLIKAAQVEGSDFNPGDLFKFARRAKIAGPGLSTDFIFGTAPAMMQDMTPEGFGTALSSAYQAFVIGSNAVASKQNLAAQKEMGLRKGAGKGELVNSELFASNPFQWVRQNLVPALERSGVDLKNSDAVSKAIAKLSRNTMATGMLTRMVQQRDQIERLIELYKGAQGTAAANDAATNDPYIAFSGLINSLKMLSESVIGPLMPAIVAGLNGMAGGITTLSEAIRSAPDFVKVAVGIATGLAIIVASAKMAAAMLGMYSRFAGGAAAGAVGTAAGAAAAGGASGFVARALGAVGGLSRFLPGVGLAAGGLLAGHQAGEALKTATPSSTYKSLQGVDDATLERSRRAQDQMRRDPEAARGAAFNRITSTPINPEAFAEAEARSAQAGETIKNNLSVTAKPTVDATDIRAALTLTQQLEAALGRISGLSAGARAGVAGMNSSFSDFGVSP